MERLLLFLVFLSTIFFLAYVPSQAEFSQIILGFTIAFGAYFYLLKNKLRFDLRFLIAIGVVGRIGLVFAFPNLSDDIYRFVWDGKLLLDGINPYSVLPNQMQTDDAFLQSIFPLLNSPAYYSIYPPFAQLLFALSAIFERVEIASIIIKLFFVGFELISLRYLYLSLLRLKLNPKNLIIYWLNPLIIIELVGNLHFETMMICFLSLFLFYLISDKLIRAAIFLGFSVASKLLPLMFGPVLLSYLWKDKRKFIFFLVFGIVILLSFAPILLSSTGANFGESLNLYFQKFEFNASIYYLLRELGILLTGYNQIAIIGPLLSLITVSLILGMAIKFKMNKLDFIHIILASFFVYLMNATTVHPWYLCILIFLNCFFNYKFIVLWSFLIVSSYLTYTNPDFIQSLPVIFLEYLIVLLCLLFVDLKPIKANFSRIMVK